MLASALRWCSVPSGDQLTKKIREMVMLGSVITLSPVFASTITLGLLCMYCSAIKGLMLALKAPVPKPSRIRPSMNGAIALPLVNTVGIAETMSKM